MAHSMADDHTNLIQQRTVLLATDNKNSVLAEVVVGRTNRMAYSAYGHQSAKQDVTTSLGFNGQLREARVGWYLLGNGYRAYNPRLMRFHSPDNLSPFGAGGLNAYMYCGGEPVMNKDPTGHAFFPAIQSLFNNVMASVSTAASNFKTLRASGVGALDAFKGVSSQPLLLSGAKSSQPGFVGGMVRPSRQLPQSPKGGLISNMNHWDALEARMQPGYRGSSTPLTSDSAAHYGTGNSNGGASMWDRLAARTQSTQVAVVSPNYGPSRQVAVVQPNQSTVPPATASGSSSAAPVNRPVATVQPYALERRWSSNSTWSGESGASDWSASSSNSSIRGNRR